MNVNPEKIIIILIALVLLGMIYLMFRSLSLSGVPLEQRFQRINEQIETMLGLCERHGWQITDLGSALALAKAKQYAFNQQDYETLVSQMEATEREEWQARVLAKKPDGSIDYDRTCAREITLQTEDIPTYLTRLVGDLWKYKIDLERLYKLELIASAIKLQWGKELD